MRFCLILMLLFTLLLSSEFSDDPEYGLWIPYTGFNYNFTSETGLFMDSPLYTFSGSNSYWPTLIASNFVGSIYTEIDGSGFAAGLFNIISENGFKTHATPFDSVDGQYARFHIDTGPGETGVVTIEGTFLPRFQWGFLFGDDILHGIGFNFNMLSIGQDGPGGLVIHANNAAIEMGLQYQLVKPIGDRYHWNPSISYNYFGGNDDKGSSIIIDNEFVVKATEYFSLYAHAGWARRSIETRHFSQREDGKHVYNTISFKLALALHNIPLFGRTYGYN